MSKDKRVDDYIAAFPPKTRAALRKVRGALRKAAPGAEETISYRIPALRGNGMLVYFAGFKNQLYMARFCKRILVIRDGLLVRDDPVADRLRAPEELLVVKREEEAAKLLAAS